MKVEIKTEELKKYSIFVGTPMYGGQCAGLFAKSTTDLATMCAKYGIDVRFYYLFNESLVQRARNYVVDEFLRSEMTHLMFIDSDIGFAAKDVLALLGLQVSNPDEYDIMAGPYPKKAIAWEKIKQASDKGYGEENPLQLQHFSADYVFNIKKGVTSFRLDEPVEVSEAGTGFMLIPREVFEKYDEAYPEYSYKPDHIRTDNFNGEREIMAYFDCAIDPESKRYLSEDYFFCRNASKVGIKIHMCPWLVLQHVGTHVFSGTMSALAQLGASPTAGRGTNPAAYKKKTKQKKKAFRP